MPSRLKSELQQSTVYDMSQPAHSPDGTSKWTGPAGLDDTPVADVWSANTVAQLKADLIAKARSHGTDLSTNPRELLADTELCQEIFPHASDFNNSTQWWASSIKTFMKTLVDHIETFGVAEALAFCKDANNGVENFVITPLQPLVEHVANCSALDAVCIDGALVTVMEWFKGVDSRTIDRSFKLMTDNPSIFITVSGAGKSPFLIHFLLKMVLEGIEEIKKYVPGGLSAVVTAGTNYPGWRTTVPHLYYRTLFIWEELFQGIKQANEKSDKKMSLEECIRMYNSMSNAGDLRASIDGVIHADTKVSLMAGLQFKAMHEYLGSDTKGALERFTFYLSDAQTAKDTSQAYRKGDRKGSAAMLRKMLAEHIKFFFPPSVMAHVRAARSETAGPPGAGPGI